MMAEHTPWPWKWNEERPATYDLEWLQGSNGYRILTIYGNGKETADKLLIAAAPELLAACEAELDVYDGMDVATLMPKTLARIAALRAAVEKATPPPQVQYATVNVVVLGVEVPIEVEYIGEKNEDELYEMAKEQLRRLI
jgi:hypothetical protein